MTQSEYDEKAQQLLIEFARAYNPKQPLGTSAKYFAWQLAQHAKQLDNVEPDYPEPDE